MRAKELPPLKYLNECFELSGDSPSGLIWKKRPREHFPTTKGWESANRQFSGKATTHIWTCVRTGKQYYTVSVLKKNYPAHRIVYSLRYNLNLSPNDEIDHVDNNGLNNSEKNLRLATHTNNQCNMLTQRNNTSGLKGVFWHKQGSAWHGKIWLKGKCYSLGFSPSKEIMGEIVREFREKLHKEFTNHGNE